ncbi:maleylpyruvate isomerase N-terminal domain-containing protein [Dactylosporangium aurantiacum]|uniref:Maleylpyruvate isomerase N-terminal domain-containing protein n=1 Tax=Dactylosporangium aurantiacum TaxID=35754 RepID=A0A9Q9IM19_9ACTN|nr:maleylpyruvate isomerase N-terminal domain-containing protein [Dactylosporangium aurantiacum]MDG6107834.1 maleylpyruvate isomerase N-terminal domain-containing protein [Dactylosporangium aurantiacum]UWZ57393.1 maleylpyruvate isomerase N-terminal domain-containing protein [Dactylosporangium aurantiacum]
MIRPAFLDTAEVAAALVRSPAVDERWAAPSALPGFTVGGLARHLANQVTRTLTLLADPPGESAIPVLDHFTGAGWVTSGAGSADNAAILRRSEDAAAQTSAAVLADEVDAALAELRTVVPAQHPDRVVDLGRWGLAVDDFLLTRLLELVVHTDDLAVSLDVPTPDLPAAATDATVQLLARLAVWRHGPLPVLRALTRQERAPGSVAAL